MNERQVAVSGKGHLSGRDWVFPDRYPRA
jgi:hypothetical protein